MSWQLHWLEATSDLGPWRDRIAAEVAATREHLAEFLPPPRLDMLVQRLPPETMEFWRRTIWR